MDLGPFEEREMRKSKVTKNTIVAILDEGEAVIPRAEVQNTLMATVQPTERIKLGSLLRSIALEAGGLTDTELNRFDQARDKSPAEPMRFE